MSRLTFSWVETIDTPCAVCERALHFEGAVKVAYTPVFFGTYCHGCVQKLYVAAAERPETPPQIRKKPPPAYG
jgi:hypothetical protein